VWAEGGEGGHGAGLIYMVKVFMNVEFTWSWRTTGKGNQPNVFKMLEARQRTANPLMVLLEWYEEIA
jgi:hypothetical protein